jgi:peptide/nickel transport system permease protein
MPTDSYPAQISAQQAIENSRQAILRRDRRAARRWAEYALRLAPNSEEPWLYLAALASPRASLVYLQKALEICPASQRAQRGMAWAIERLNKLHSRQARAALAIPSQRLPARFPSRHSAAVSAQSMEHMQQARGKITLLSKLGKNLSLTFGVLILIGFVIIALAAPLIAPPDPGVEFSTFKDIGQLNRYVPLPPEKGLILGSVPDQKNSRQLDIWYSLVWGTRSAMLFGLSVVLVAGTFGVLLGGVSAYVGGMSNMLIMGFTDAFLSIPVIAGVIFFQQIILMYLSSSGIVLYFNGMLPSMESPTAFQSFLAQVDPLLIAFIVFSWMPYSRLMNSVVSHTRQEEYILAARSVGVGHIRLIFRHLLPNCISPAFVLAARDIGYMVILQAGFTFIGLSQRSEWGVLLSLSRNYVIGPGGNPLTWWWIYLTPTLTIWLFGVCWILIGDGLNDRLNPYQIRR